MILRSPGGGARLLPVTIAFLVGCQRDESLATAPGAPQGSVVAATVGAPYLSLTPDGATLAAPSNSSGSYTFTVSWFWPFSSLPTTFKLVCSSSGSVSCTGLSVYGVTLSSGQTAAIDAHYTVSSGTGRLVLTACDGPGLPGGPCALASFFDSGYVIINPAPAVTIAGATSVSSPGTYTWTANAIGGDDKVAVTSAMQTASSTIFVDNTLWEAPCPRVPCPK